MDFFETTSAKWRKEQDDILRKIEQHKNADRAYIDEGVLELAQKAARLYKKQSMAEKRRLLNFVHSNSSWKNGELTTNYRKPLDLLAVSNRTYTQKKTAFPVENGLFEFWLPIADSNHGQGD